MANSSLSLGTGRGDALLTAFSADLSKISSPLLEITSASITVPSDINLNENENKKVNYNLNELVKTEDSFFTKISHLPQQFQTLLENNLLSQEEFNSYSAIINPLLSEAKALNTQLQELKGKNLNEQIRTVLELYSPSKIQTYLKASTSMII